MFSGYYRTSRRSGVIYPLWLWIIFLPAALVFGIFWGIIAFINTERISAPRKALVLLLIIAGVVMIVVSAGSHCDLTGACHQSKLEGDVSAYGAVMLMLAAFLVILGIDGKGERQHG